MPADDEGRGALLIPVVRADIGVSHDDAETLKGVQPVCVVPNLLGRPVPGDPPQPPLDGLQPARGRALLLLAGQEHLLADVETDRTGQGHVGVRRRSTSCRVTPAAVLGLGPQVMSARAGERCPAPCADLSGVSLFQGAVCLRRRRSSPHIASTTQTVASPIYTYAKKECWLLLSMTPSWPAICVSFGDRDGPSSFS